MADPGARRFYRSAMGAIPKPPAGHFNVLYFASASSFTHREHDVLPAPLAIDKLFGVLEEKYPGIADKVLASCLVTVNLNYVEVKTSDGEEPVVLREGDEVGIIPPVSSG
ncbi:this family protein [Xylariaceae sp. FL1272]|nr:this family protein [Xylariaceae sp. FL1272]